MNPPKAKKINKILKIHDHERNDPYYWLNERDNPEVMAYLTAENEYVEQQLKHTEPLQEKLYNEIVGRIKQDDSTVPYQYQGYWYYIRFEQGKEYPIYCRKKGTLEGEEQVLLDVNVMAQSFDYYQVSGVKVSSNNNLISFGVDTVGRRNYTIMFKDLEKDQILTDRLPNTIGQSVWANDNNTIFYPVKDETLRPFKIYKHTLGEEQIQDVEVYHEKDATFNCYVQKSKSKEYIFISSHSTLSSEYRYLKADAPKASFQILQKREKELEYSVDHLGDKFYILNNLKAKNFKLSEAPVEAPQKENWKDIIPHREDVLLENVELFKDFLVLEERANGLEHIRIKRWDGAMDYYIQFPDPAYSAGIGMNPEVETEWLRFHYSSLTTPPSTFEQNMQTEERNLLKQQEVLGGFNSEEYVSERIFATAADGTKVPVSLVYQKRSFNKDGSNPCLLYGYGSYGHSMDASFRYSIISLLERGFVYAIAHIRGGEDMGRYWYEEGKLLKKKNTFTDFIACAEHLINKKYTSKEKLFAMGGSAGGLLMGAIANLRPELFKGIISSVPFVDVVTTMLDDSIPLTTGEYDEWGNPNDPEYYKYILSYSPYDNIEAKEYPAMLVLTGLHDSQVQYWEPAKYVAKLRDIKKGDQPLYFKTNLSAGHSGASGRFERFKETALEFAFMFNLLGIEE